MHALKQRLRQRFQHGAVLRYRTFFLLAWDLKAWWQSCRNALSLSDRRRRRGLLGASELSINLGSGGRGVPGWVNTDLIRCSDTTITVNLCRPLPFRSGSAARILAEHVFEHLDLQRDGLPLLRECRRVLQPGGWLRLIVPDFEAFCRAYVHADVALWQALGMDPLPSDLPTPALVLGHVHQQDGEHFFGFDFQTMEWALRQAGFTEIRRAAFAQSADPHLAIDQANHAPYSLYVEARCL